MEVRYITGNGRSGSTLLDMLIGGDAKCFNAGELTNIARDGMLDELCPPEPRLTKSMSCG